MIDRRSLFGLCVIIFVGVWAHGDQDEGNSVKGSMTVGGHAYNLTYIKAYRINSDGKDSVAVIVSQKPFQITKAKLFPPEKPTWIDLGEVSEPTQFKEIRRVIPHLQVIFDAQTGKIASYQGWARNTTFMSRSNSVTITTSVGGKIQSVKQSGDVSGNWTAELDGNQVIGSGKYTSEFKEEEAYDFEFKASIEQIEFDVAPKHKPEYQK